MSRLVCVWPDCGQSFSCDYFLGRHEQTAHLRLRPYSCLWPQCSFGTQAQRSTVVQHIRKEHFGLPSTLALQHTLNIVDDRDPNQFVSVNTELASVRLRDCECINIVQLNDSFFVNPSKRPKTKRCKYPGCTKAFTTEVNLAYHERIHLDVKPYTCMWEKCGLQFRQLGTTLTHIRRVHLGLPATQEEQHRLGIAYQPNVYDFIHVDKDLATLRLHSN